MPEVIQHPKEKIEKVVWYDSQQDDTWTDDVDVTLTPIASVGYVVGESATAIVMTLAIDLKNQTYMSQLQIPKCSIVSRKKIKL